MRQLPSGCSASCWMLAVDGCTRLGGPLLHAARAANASVAAMRSFIAWIPLAAWSRLAYPIASGVQGVVGGAGAACASGIHAHDLVGQRGDFRRMVGDQHREHVQLVVQPAKVGE